MPSKIRLSPQEIQLLALAQKLLKAGEHILRQKRDIARLTTKETRLVGQMEKALRIIVGLRLSQWRLREERDKALAELARYQRLHGRED